MKVIGERKAVAARLAEITGEASVYTRMPRCAYEVGAFVIERDGGITVVQIQIVALAHGRGRARHITGQDDSQVLCLRIAFQKLIPVRDDRHGAEMPEGVQNAGVVEGDPVLAVIFLPYPTYFSSFLRFLSEQF